MVEILNNCLKFFLLTKVLKFRWHKFILYWCLEQLLQGKISLWNICDTIFEEFTKYIPFIWNEKLNGNGYADQSIHVSMWFCKGCQRDATSLIESWCSGKQSCDVAVPNDEFENPQWRPCVELQSYLDVSYTCLKGMCGYNS